MTNSELINKLKSALEKKEGPGVQLFFEDEEEFPFDEYVDSGCVVPVQAQHLYNFYCELRQKQMVVENAEEDLAVNQMILSLQPLIGLIINTVLDENDLRYKILPGWKIALHVPSDLEVVKDYSVRGFLGLS